MRARSASSTSATPTRVYGYHLRRSQDAARRARPDGRDVRAGLALARALPRRGARLGRALAVRHRPPRAARQRAPAAAGAQRLRAPRRARRASTASRRPSPPTSWLDGLDEALAHLPEAQQQAIRLRVVEDLGYDEAAERLATTPQAVRARVSRGLSALRKHLFDSMEMTR